MRVLGFLFDTESTFGRLMTKIGVIVVSNLMFLLFSIPVITIGASVTALYHVMLKEFRSSNDINPFHEFWYGFRTNLKQATICWIIAMVLLAVGRLEIYWCSQFGGFFSFVEIALWSMGGVGLIILLYLFPTIAAFQNTIINLLRNAIYFIMKKPLVAIGVVVCNVIPMMLISLDEANQPAYAFVCFFVGFALIVRICAWFLLKVFSEYLS